MSVNDLQIVEETTIADSVIADSLKLSEQSGSAEYLDPIDGAPCGGDCFTWAAAMVIEFITQPNSGLK